MSSDTKRTFISLVVILLILLLITILTRWGGDSADEQLQSDAASSTLAARYTNLFGEETTLYDTSAQYTFVLSFASWCPQCQTLLPEYVALSDEYSDRPVRLLAVNRAEPTATILEYLAYLQISTTTPAIVLDEEDTWYQTTNSYTMPELVVYNQDFVVVSVVHEPTIAAIRDELQTLFSNE